MSAVLCSHRTFLLAAFSIVEYPLQLLHSPPAPVVKRPGPLSAHHPLQVPPPRPGPAPSGMRAPLCPLLLPSFPASLSPLPRSGPRAPGPSGVADPWRLPQEPSQPLNLTAKPKASELPNSSSSPNLKLSNCGPRPPSHGAPTLDLQANPPSLPLGKPPAFPC